MINYISIILLGFFLGMRHATDPDHVIAVTTIVSRQRRFGQATFIGALWGMGHTITILLVGSAIILFGIVISPRVGLTMEISVGVMMIVLGFLNLTGAMRWITEAFMPPTGALSSHPHIGEVLVSHGSRDRWTASGWTDRTIGSLGLYQAMRPLTVGVIHGLAGSAAIALLALTTIRSPGWAAAYLLVFGIGTVAGMMLITTAIAMPFTYSMRRVKWLNRSLGLASGFVSLGFGLFIVYQMAYVNGMFSGHPRWAPH